MLDPRLHSLLSGREVTVVRDLARSRDVPVILVGGAVRDALLSNSEPHDFDFAVQGDAIALGRAVANTLGADFYVMDAERGTARVLLPFTGHGWSFEGPQPLVTTLDFAVRRGESWWDDLRARDFTVNAIALDLNRGAVIDEVGGVADLKARTIRATSDHALADDPVRALRAVRLAFELDMHIEPHTLSQVKAVGAGVMQPSAERVRDEFMAILDLPGATRALRALDDLGLLAYIVPEIEAMRTCEQSAPHRFSVLDHTWVVMETLDAMISDFVPDPASRSENRNGHRGRFRISDSNRQSTIRNLTSEMVEGRTRAAIYRLAALLHDCAKPNTKSVDEEGKIHFYGHEPIGAEMAAARARALRLSGDEVSRVRTIVRNHMRANQMARQMKREQRQPTPRALYRFFREAGDCAEELALFALADCVGKRGDQTMREDCEPSVKITELLLDAYHKKFARSVAPEPLITGKDVLELGVKQGPRIGEILESVREAHMTGEIGTRDEALALAKKMIDD